jgi:hypothetical protein
MTTHEWSPARQQAHAALTRGRRLPTPVVIPRPADQADLFEVAEVGGGACLCPLTATASGGRALHDSAQHPDQEEGDR